MHTKTIAVFCTAAALLVACGGGSNSGDAPAPVAASDAVPDSASQSAKGMVAWLAALTREDAEAKAPLDAARFTPPAVDNAEPLALP